ncbi:hypothetical protein [Pararhizobium sp.]|uniref:hypothetical protein n=1 Tax=Pararhizobium sp. TaxID=1977563 RepID=UPI002722E954|nr:hypothetical protein [Pararhizobium sp.]MDO9415784.1 hypothetical protein [Pararhizobium sp.]
MFGKVSRLLLGVSLLAVLAGCNKTESAAALETTPAVETAAVEDPSRAPSVVQGVCPQVFLLDGTSAYRKYAKGGATDDPKQITYQGSLADTTRQCILSNDQMVITVVAQGRVLAGPAGGPGTINLPIRVAVNDGKSTLYSELVQLPVEIPAGGTNQFVFTQANVTIPAGSAADAKIYVGFDEGPPKKKK